MQNRCPLCHRKRGHGAGVCKYSEGYRNHVDSEDKGVNEMVTPGGTQQAIVINESGLYSLILASKLPQVRAFKRWVTNEVLPQVRQTGVMMQFFFAFELRSSLLTLGIAQM